jgi:hypothetical protein
MSVTAATASSDSAAATWPGVVYGGTPVPPQLAMAPKVTPEEVPSVSAVADAGRAHAAAAAAAHASARRASLPAAHGGARRCSGCGCGCGCGCCASAAPHGRGMRRAPASRAPRLPRWPAETQPDDAKSAAARDAARRRRAAAAAARAEHAAPPPRRRRA